MIVSVLGVDDEACRQAAKWLTESGYALEMRVAAVCRKYF
jgi:hypothetical protein